MRPRGATVAAVACLLLAGIPAALADGASEAGTGVAQRLLVRLDQPVSAADEQSLAEAVGARHAGRSRPGVFSVEVDEARAGDVLARLRARPEVDLAEAEWPSPPPIWARLR